MLFSSLFINIWASTRKNLSSGFANAFTQSDWRLCYSFTGKYHINTCFKQNFNILASLCSCGDWFESQFLGHPED